MINKKHVLEFHPDDRLVIPIDLFVGGIKCEALEKDLLQYEGVEINRTNKQTNIVFSSWDRMEEILKAIQLESNTCLT